MQFTVSVKRSGNRNHFMPEQLVYRRDRYWVQPCMFALFINNSNNNNSLFLSVRGLCLCMLRIRQYSALDSLQIQLSPY